MEIFWDTVNNGESCQVPHIKGCLFQGATKSQLLRVDCGAHRVRNHKVGILNHRGLSKVGYAQHSPQVCGMIARVNAAMCLYNDYDNVHTRAFAAVTTGSEEGL